MKFKILSPGYDYKKNREQQLSIVTGLFEPTLGPKCRVPCRGTRHKVTKFSRIYMSGPVRAPTPVTFLLGYYDAAGMSSRTPASQAGPYPHAKECLETDRGIQLVKRSQQDTNNG